MMSVLLAFRQHYSTHLKRINIYSELQGFFFLRLQVAMLNVKEIENNGNDE